jgi:hypothetical protein
MFLIDFLPDWVFHVVTVVGVLGIVAGFLLGSIPFIKTYAREIQIGAVILTVLGVWFEGGIAAEDKWQKRVSAVELKLAKAEAESADTNAKLGAELAKNKTLVDEKVAAQRERLKAEAVQLNKECKFNSRVIDVINDAAKNRTGSTK